MAPVETLQTERLTAERLRGKHYADLCRMYQDPRVTATLGGLRSPAETWRYLEAALDHWEQQGFGLWVFHNRADGRFAGRGGLRRTAIDGTEGVELAYAFMPEFWGQGLATEIARASLRVGFEDLRLKDVICFTLTTNRASRRVMEKVGFRYERDGPYAGLPHVFYRLTAAQWERGAKGL